MLLFFPLNHFSVCSHTLWDLREGGEGRKEKKGGKKGGGRMSTSFVLESQVRDLAKLPSPSLSHLGHRLRPQGRETEREKARYRPHRPRTDILSVPVLKRMLRRKEGRKRGGGRRGKGEESHLLILDDPTSSFQPNILHEIGE